MYTDQTVDELEIISLDLHGNETGMCIIEQLDRLVDKHKITVEVRDDIVNGIEERLFHEAGETFAALKATHDRAVWECLRRR